MWSLETILKLNDPDCREFKDDPLRNHPRILSLHLFVNRLPVSCEYKMRLKRSIYLYADQIVARPVYASEEGWSDEEALQQVTLGDWNEEFLNGVIR
jgi:hypothetical protein